MNRFAVSFVIGISCCIIYSCSYNSSKISENKFIGTWKLEGRAMYTDMLIKINRENNELIGRIFKKNTNKYVQLFADSNDVWISEIKRNSNFEFTIKESKIARELFGLYNQSTSQELKVQFLNDSIIGCAIKDENPLSSKVRYCRVKDL